MSFKKNKYIPYAKQCISNKDITEVLKVLKSDYITQGPIVKDFEEALAHYAGTKYAVCVSNGTAALHCAVAAAKIKRDDEIITSPITFAASGNCALFCDAKVKFADIKQDTYCIDYEKVETAISKHTKAIIPVDFSGQPCDMDEINRISRKHGLITIHDAAHSLGASYKGKLIGSLAAMTIFSFHPAKNITTGEGGAILTNNKSFYKKLLLLRNHGITRDSKDIPRAKQAPWYYEMQMLGFNYRISDIQCSLGLSQLKKLDFFIAKRRNIAEEYNKAFSNCPYLLVPYQEKDRKSAWHIYVLQLRLNKMKKTRRKVFEQLRAKNIGVQVHYIPLHLQPYYRKRFGYRKGDFPCAEKFYESALTIPLFPSLKNRDVNRIIDAVLQVVC